MQPNAVGGQSDGSQVGDDSDAGARVTCRAVTHVYGTDRRGGWRRATGETVTALEDVSLAVGTDEFVAITGPSGSGKSTLLHLLAALDTPTDGTVRIDGTDTMALSDRKRTRLRRERVGLVFQRFHLLPALSARGNVALPLIDRGVGRRARRERAVELLERVGLGNRATHKPGQLSGGEQQRVAIARALVGNPTLVVADEPTGELDTATGERVLDLFREVSPGRAVVIASHDQQVVDRADRVIELRDGRRQDG